MNKEDKISLVMNCLIDIRHFSTKINKQIKEDFSKSDINCSESFYLILLSNSKDGLTMGELSNLTKVDKSLTSRIVQKLIDKEYVYRDTNDLSSRNYKIKLTSLGFDKARKINDVLVDKYDSFISNYTKEEILLMNKSFKLLLDKFNL